MDAELRREFIKYQRRTERWIDRINAKPSYPWLSTATATFLAIPGLRGFWPMSSVGDSIVGTNSLVTDISGQSRHLTNNGVALLSFDNLAPCYNFDGTNDYLSRADEAGLDIIGTEGYITPSYQGLTIGGWYKFAALGPANPKGIIGKWDATTNDMSYLVYIPPGTSTAVFLVSTTGGAVAATATSTFTLIVDTWYFIVARYDPSTEVSITVNGTQNEDTSAVGVPANLFNGAAAFNIMAHQNGAATTRNQGYASFCFLSCAWLSGNIINHLYEMSRGMFGV